MKTKEIISQRLFLSSLAQALIQDTHHAEDIVQDIQLAHLSGPKKNVIHMRSWLSAAVRNRMRMIIRGESRRRERERAAAAREKMPAVDEEVAKQEILRIVVNAVLKLDEIYRKPLILRFYENLPHQEAARKLGVPVETMRSRMKVGLKKVKNRLEREYNGDTKRWVMALAPLAGLKLLDSAAKTAAGAQTIAKKSIGAAALLKFSAAILLIGVATFTVTQFVINDTSIEPDRDLTRKSETPPIDTIDNGDASEGGELTYLDSKTPREIEAPTQKTVNLEGRLRSREKNDPIPGADVSLALRYSEEQWEIVGDTKTGEDGVFSLMIPEEQMKGVDGLILSLNAQGFIDMDVRRMPVLKEDGFHLNDIYLNEDRTYTIPVMDQHRNPIAHATARFYKARSGLFISELKTGPDGLLCFKDSDVARRRWEADNLHLHISAPGMTDLFHPGIWSAKRPRMPETIQLAPASAWQGRIVDAETGQGVVGAEVKFHGLGEEKIKHKPFKQEMTEKFHAVTDDSGWFSMPRLNCSSKDLAYNVQAEGYRRLVLKPGTLPELIELKKPRKSRKCLALERGSGKPLTHMMIESPDGYRDRTDAAGLFSLSPSRGYSITNSPGIIARHKEDQAMCWICTNKPSFKKMVKEPLEMEFDRAFQTRKTILVKDIMGNPICGATLTYPSGGDTACVYSDEDGRATIHYQVKGPTDLPIVVAHTQFMLKDDSVRLDERNDGLIEKEIILSRRILVQNIQVLDEFGLPVSNQMIDVQFTFENGEPRYDTHFSNEQGYLEFLAPDKPIKKLIILNRYNLDHCLELGLEDLLEGDDHTLVLYKEKFLITGTVQDASGRLLEGVRIQFKVQEGPYSFPTLTESDKDGYFELNVNRSAMYSVSVLPFSKGNYWYWSEGKNSVFHGENLALTLDHYTGIQCWFATVPGSNKFKDKKYAATLESPDGDLFEAEHVFKMQKRVLFLGVPEGKMRATIQAGPKCRFTTAMFKMTAGKSLEINFGRERP